MSWVKADEAIRAYMDSLPTVTGLIEGKWNVQEERPLGDTELRIWRELDGEPVGQLEPWGVPMEFAADLPEEGRRMIEEALARQGEPILARVHTGKGVQVAKSRSTMLLEPLRAQHTATTDGAGITICARCLEAWPCEHTRGLDAHQEVLETLLQTARMLAHDAQRGYQEAHIQMLHRGYFRSCQEVQCRLARALVVRALGLTPEEPTETEGGDHGTV